MSRIQLSRSGGSLQIEGSGPDSITRTGKRQILRSADDGVAATALPPPCPTAPGHPCGGGLEHSSSRLARSAGGSVRWRPTSGCARLRQRPFAAADPNWRPTPLLVDSRHMAHQPAAGVHTGNSSMSSHDEAHPDRRAAVIGPMSPSQSAVGPRIRLDGPTAHVNRAANRDADAKMTATARRRTDGARKRSGGRDRVLVRVRVGRPSGGGRGGWRRILVRVRVARHHRRHDCAGQRSSPEFTSVAALARHFAQGVESRENPHGPNIWRANVAP
jgi:hypothetical protein